jgi:hypothetical protein
MRRLWSFLSWLILLTLAAIIARNVEFSLEERHGHKVLEGILASLPDAVEGLARAMLSPLYDPFWHGALLVLTAWLFHELTLFVLRRRARRQAAISTSGPAVEPQSTIATTGRNYCVCELLFDQGSTYLRRENIFDVTHFAQADGTIIFHIIFDEPFSPHVVEVNASNKGPNPSRQILRQSTRFCSIAVRGALTPGRIWIAIYGEGFDPRRFANQAAVPSPQLPSSTAQRT